jgi:hypothetical protein
VKTKETTAANEDLPILGHLERSSIAPEIARNLEQHQFGKFHTRNGHGFAAEDANALSDRLNGRHVVETGGQNTVCGPDRIVDGVQIQTKYWQTPTETIAAAFDSKTGQFAYKGQVIEVPKEQYQDCLRLMREKISSGKVPGISDPEQAAQLVRPGEVTYAQAKNIARAGTLDSLQFDAKTQAVLCSCAFGLSFAVTMGQCLWDGKSCGEAVQAALASGVKTGGIAFISGVAGSQALRSGAARVGAVTMQQMVKPIAGTHVGGKVVSRIASASLGKSVQGAAAVNHLAKLLRSNFITSAITTIVISSPDLYRAAFERSISWKQLGKNLLVNAAGVAGGVGGWMATGAAMGSAVPGPGTIAGMVVGGIIGGFLGGWGAKKITDQMIEDDAKEMIEILQQEVVAVAEDHMLTSVEFDKLVLDIKPLITAAFLRGMFKTKENEPQRLFARAELALEKRCADHLSARKKIQLPTNDEVRNTVAEILTLADA